ncbi:GLUG motif-containing protein, partial [Halopseudomonas sp. Lyrl_26]|uniref:GLUG motif-containing protein n=1 Tax=Halopseudomonas sp. Lyrl_26 TaxID=3110923 RepID=UPI003F7F36DA
SNRFTGTFDGLGHVISDLFIDRETTNYVGLFGYTDTATLRHVGLENIDITGQNQVGGLAGYQWTGGISQSYATGAVNGNISVGGLVGVQLSSSISESYATGAVTGTIHVGGLVGHQSSTARISQSYATGAVNGTNNVGGLVGYQWIGGIIQSYATGAVNGNSSVGGLVGSLYSGTNTNSFYATTDNDNNNITGDHTHSSGGTGRTWAELMNRDTFAGWDDSVWGFVDGAEYEGYALGGLPYLIGVTREEDIVVSNETLFDSGWGTDTAPWTITNWHQLQNIN